MLLAIELLPFVVTVFLPAYIGRASRMPNVGLNLSSLFASFGKVRSRRLHVFIA